MNGIIFDMDGVIVDSEPLHERAFRQVFDQIGYGETHGIDFTSYYGKSDLILWQDFVAKHQPAHTLADLLAWKESRFADMLREEEPIFAGLPELLERAGQSHVLGIASGSRHSTIRSVLELRDLRRHFRAVVSSEDVPRGKPAPDVFLRAAELLEVNPRHCWVIEDSAAGVHAGLAAGMKVIAITNTLPAEKLSHATHVVKTYEEIGRLLFSEVMA